MTIQHIRETLEQIERRLFEHSIHSRPSTELLNLRQAAFELKRNFLSNSFIGAKTLDELEDIRFRIVEVRTQCSYLCK